MGRFRMNYFYNSLARLARYPTSSAQVHSEIFKKVAVTQEKMKQWAHCASMNHFHKYNLVQAEIARVLGHLSLHHHLHRRNDFTRCMTEELTTKNISCLGIHDRLQQSIGLTKCFRSGNG